MKLQSTAAIACLLLSQSLSFATAQQTTPLSTGNVTAGLPAEPTPNATKLGVEHPGLRDYSKPNRPFPNIIKPYLSVPVASPNFYNSPRLGDLLKDGKIYLSLSDAILLALENNYDIAIARYNLDIADTDILRAKSGAFSILGVNSGLVTGTLGGSSSTLSSGGGPGGTTAGTSGATSGSTGLQTSGLGPTPETLDPVITGQVQLERTRVPQSTTFLTGQSSLNQNTDFYNFGYQQGFLTGTGLNVTFNNSRQTSNSIVNSFSPTLSSAFKAQVTQHLLQGFGTGINGRFIAQAVNDRRITDSSFRLQLLYTINQVENIYWALVSSYEDTQSKQRAVDQSTQVASDDRKQLKIGTLAPLDVLNADNAVATDKQALISSQTNLQYQQLVMKQAIARNLNDPLLTAAPVIPTDRVSLIETPEEQMPVDQLVAEAYMNRPEIEQSLLTLKNAQITVKGIKNGLLPTVDLYAYYSGNAIGGAVSPFCNPAYFGAESCNVSPVGYSSVFQNLFNSSGPDKAVGVNLNIPLRNRQAQAAEARSVLEYRQDQMKLEQQYVQVRIQVINKQYALTNDRAAVQAAMATRDYNQQALLAEQKKYRLGASTSAAVLQQQRSLAAAENTVISDLATYAIDRASLEQVVANTLQKYGINTGDAVSGKMNAAPVIPGLEPAPKAPEAGLPPQQQQLEKTREAPAVPPSPMAPQGAAPQSPSPKPPQ